MIETFVQRKGSCVLALSASLLVLPLTLHAQGRYFAGAGAGVSTLSADGRSVIDSDSTAISLYKPENGAALDLFGGIHLADYVGLQANYIWNRNSLTLTSTRIAGGAQTLYEQKRGSDEQSVIGDLLIYFRNRRSRVRPYLSGGLGAVHFSSQSRSLVAMTGAPALPPDRFTANHPALRVAVGMDLNIGRGAAFRYSFSETMSDNPISAQLSPPGQRRLANFQNLFGFVKRF